MQDYTRLKAQALADVPANRDEVAWLLVVEQLIYQAEAEARWLDHCESRLVRLAEAAATEPSAEPGPAATRGPARSLTGRTKSRR